MAAITIDVEARTAIRQIVDSDRYKNIYKKLENDITINFVSPIHQVYEDNRYYILKNSFIKPLDSKYYYRPDYLSYDEYDTTQLWELILFINGFSSIDSFRSEYIYLPTFGVITELAKFDKSQQDPIDVDVINREPDTGEVVKLYTSRVFPVLEESAERVVSVTEELEMAFIRQKFTINETMIQNKYVDLAYFPIPESMNAKIVGNTIALVYDVHFTIVEKSNGDLKRVSWSSADNPVGDGLETILVIGNVLDIQYAKDENP